MNETIDDLDWMTQSFCSDTRLWIDKEELRNAIIRRCKKLDEKITKLSNPRSCTNETAKQFFKYLHKKEELMRFGNIKENDLK